MTVPDEQLKVIAETNLRARMRDGISLAADVYRPHLDAAVPVLLVRTIYNKIQAAERYLPFVPANGYALVVQDVRGRFASEGVFEQDVNDAWGELRDGYDSVEWVADQEWCDGQVAVTGLSAPGCAAALLMPTQPPHLSAGYLEVSGGAFDNYLYRWYHGGVFRYRVLEWLLTSMGPDVVAKEVTDAGERDRVLSLLDELLTDPVKMLEAFRALPLAPPPIVGHLKAPGFDFWNDYLDNPARTDYWKSVSVRGKVDAVDVPVMHVTGWFDIMLQGTIDMFTEFQERGGQGARGRQQIIIGPWTHPGLWTARAGDLEFPGADRAFSEHLLSYLDATLKQQAGEAPKKPTVAIYVMGDNAWRTEDEWPLARTVYTKYYFRDGVGGSLIDSLNGNKLLSLAEPDADEDSDGYSYDPANPMMTIGGRTNDPVKGGAIDHRESDRRSITFTTPPLDADIEVTGQLKAVLYAASSAPDTDWFVKLTDVHPDGRSMFVAHGLVRARYRESWEDESLLKPGKVYRYEIDLWATSQVFKRGHCIRAAVTSSDFPAYERNLNTGADNHRTSAMQVAQQTIYHDQLRPSHIVLPVIPRARME